MQLGWKTGAIIPELKVLHVHVHVQYTVHAYCMFV